MYAQASVAACPVLLSKWEFTLLETKQASTY